ncbi:hypothetical protein [Streptomyces sp. WAC00263]|uniref:hypothetical protein n=1 Tax=Streptomyces sp. WAC00263 TaxID=1917422 RepID=UPI001F509030|nr:hypothetical protein [Streptomyces sp. WAC00263]
MASAGSGAQGVQQGADLCGDRLGRALGVRRVHRLVRDPGVALRCPSRAPSPRPTVAATPRNGLFSRLLVVLVGVAVLLLGYSLFRENLSARLTRDWP